MATKTKFQKANLKDVGKFTSTRNCPFFSSLTSNVDFSNANLISAQFEGANIEGADFTDSLLDKVTMLSLCKRASGVNSKTQVSTAESLMCPE